MEIINAGDRIMNTWVYNIPEGFVMVDTGYPNKLSNVEKRLASHGISWSDVKYVFVTHAHDDHVGFLNELLGRCPDIKVILNPASMTVLRRGQNSFEGGYSTLGAYLFSGVLALWGKGKHLFPPLEERFDDRLLFITDESRRALEGLLRGRILFTPGHTGDSVSLQVGNVVFCGDAAMEGYPSSHHVTIWVENVAQFGRSWDTLCEGGAETVYPAHGKPFDMGELAECRSFVDSVKLRS
jgi:glyoxylase-like metal-dependent hydrolase (beta-lactamase superfamily II)